MLFSFGNTKKNPPKKKPTTFDRENQIMVIADLKRVFNKKAHITTKYPILFQGLTLDQIHVNKLEKHFGKETHILDHSEEIPGHMVFFYRKNVESLKLIIQLHFIDDIFIFGSTKVSAEAIVTDKDKQMVCKTMVNHYPDISLSKDCFEYEFMDPQGNMISTIDHIYLLINYYPNNPAVDNLKLNTNHSTFKGKQKSDNEERLDQFF